MVAWLVGTVAEEVPGSRTGVRHAAPAARVASRGCTRLEITEIRLLGPVRVERAGRPVGSFEGRKSLALLAYLASRACPVPRTFLACLLWPELGEERGRANLSGALHSLTSLVPGCADGDRYVVAYRPSPDVWLDTAAYQAHAARSDPAGLAAAVDLYADEFLAGMFLGDCPEFELWVVAMRERWRDRAARALATLVDHHVAAGDTEAALRVARRLLELEPWREEVHRQVMQLLADSGHRGCALAQFRTCCRVLEAEFDVPPAAETVALYERLRAPEGWGA